MKILIVGLGVIGASFAEGLKQKGHYIYGVDKDESTLSYALNKHIIDEGSTDIKDFMHVAKLIILCVYPRAILDILKENNFTEEQIITDVSGVKEILLTEIEKLPLKASYVSIHPMAGREKKGIMYADKSRFINANYLIIPTKFSTDEAINVMKEVACDLEFGEITIMDKKYHDHMIAKTSQLPHALAVALVLADEEVDTVKYIGMALRRSGIKTILNTKVQSISQQENGNLLVYYEEKGKSAALDSELVIVCTGRRPRSIEGLEEYCGIHFDRGIPTNEQGETSSPGIYAAGDCVRGSIQLAHYASARAVAIINSLAGKPVHTNFDSVPSCIYTIPPAAKAGLSEKEALDSGHQIQIGKFNLGANGKSLISAEERGFIKVIFDSENEQLLGIELVAAQAPEMVGMLSILIAMKAKRSDLLRGIFPHPSVSEGIMEAIEDSQKQAIHVLYR